MSDKITDLPRDLRNLCIGTVKDPDGSLRTLFIPEISYNNAWDVRRELESDLADPNIDPDDAVKARLQLRAVVKLIEEMKKRIDDYYAPQPPGNASNCGSHLPEKVDYGAKSKIEKAMADAEAGTYKRVRRSKALQAVFKALAFVPESAEERSSKVTRMPSHDELKGCGFNDQQATDAGMWLATQADSKKNRKSLFCKLLTAKEAREADEAAEAAEEDS